MICAASGLTSLVSILLIRTDAFTPSEQLLLRPGNAHSNARWPSSRNQRNQFVRRNPHVDLVYQAFANPAQDNIRPQLTETMLLERALSERPLSRHGAGQFAEITSPRRSVAHQDRVSIHTSTAVW